ncbi:hypothetical protein OEZ86_010951 [Tetradesmus obliquus]|uniref:Polyketide synthase dehydratase domain-containing protein n=1 Tax=Tetradesmus obliquus TaxID=3088 RepID=A0A383VHR9_TETOB|nr:hypothetical protein OEZ86_010951 [Tetradesmus obliquus]|eukprot:jgi/Sobl393_1/5453/SZX64379.1
MAQLEKDPELSAVLLGEDVTAMQNMLKSAYQAELARAQNTSRRQSERSMDAQRASATVPRDTVQLYQQLAASGLQYGPAFRLLRNVHVPDTSSAGTAAAGSSS